MSGDSWFYFAYDERWRMVATYRDADANANAKEHLYYHAAGLAGYGSSSYIDSVIWRDKDANTAWNSAADSTMEQRHYYCQNWRADVSAVLNDDGSEQVESIKYFSYGYPVNIPAGDYDLDGDVDVNDENQAKAWEGGSYRARADLNLDGSVTSADTAIVTANIGLSGGRGVLSRSDTGNRKGYAGYESDATADAGGSRFWHVRHRVLDSTLGRWTRRDPLGYVDGPGLLDYVRGSPATHSDPNGMIRRACRLPLSDDTIPTIIDPICVPSREPCGGACRLSELRNCVFTQQDLTVIISGCQDINGAVDTARRLAATKCKSHETTLNKFSFGLPRDIPCYTPPQELFRYLCYCDGTWNTETRVRPCKFQFEHTGPNGRTCRFIFTANAKCDVARLEGSCKTLWWPDL